MPAVQAARRRSLLTPPATKAGLGLGGPKLGPFGFGPVYAGLLLFGPG